MKAPFVVRVPTQELARELAAQLAGAPARFEVQPSPEGDIHVGVSQADGPPKWVAILHAISARDVLSFLERWGFVARPTRAA